MNDSLIDPFYSRDAPYALQTYYGYVKAWAEKIVEIHGCPSKCFKHIEAKMAELKSIQKIQGGRSLDKKIVAAFTRGGLTLKAMEYFPIQENEDLAPIANLWLPVQAYYAVHGFGLAAMFALGRDIPKDHRSFRAVFSEMSKKYFPAPLNAQCWGGPTDQQFEFLNLDATIEKVKLQSNLSNPRYADNLDCLLGKCLSTTRKRFLEALFDMERHKGVRRDKKRRNLSRGKKQNIVENLHATSVADFLYRMRIRSNYDDPDIHLLASSQETSEAVKYYQELLFLTKFTAHPLRFIIQKKIGSKQWESLQKSLSRNRKSGVRS
ncbi:MAG TPA: hypothetical protein ENN84_08725 [Candidatus Marinimicrobia bacterium]|nr:hypothetical protein [Candidatus Neomarinimicrobiota bacterium]